MKAREQSEFKKDWTGVVEAKTGEKVVQFKSLDTIKDGNKEKVKPFPNEQETIKFDIADLPKLAQRVIKPKMDAKKFRIRLNADGDEVEAVGPVSGSYQAKLVSLGPKRKEELDAVPFEKFFKKGQPEESSHLEFFAVYEITDGVFRGLQLPAYWIHYKFEGIPEGEEDEGFTRFDTIDTPQASQLHRLQEWASVHGNILEEPIGWEPDEDLVYTCRKEPVANILPVLEERALDADRDVNVIMEKGYIKSVQAQENYETEDEVDDDPDGVDDAFPPDESPAKVEEVVPPAKEMKSKSKGGTKRPPKQDDDPDL